MSLKVENIRKMMGWCPNARTSETRRHINFGSFESGIPDREKGDDGDQKNPEWLRKASTRTLLVDIFLTFMYFSVLIQLGVNLIFLLAGFFTALISFIFSWNAKMRLYDSLEKQRLTDNSNLKRLCIILTYLLFSFVIVCFYIIGYGLALQITLSFFGGYLVYFWLGYFQILYWEHKNHKKIYFDKIYGKWKKSYIIRESK
ncbi:MAG TPA: DUF1673 domain-containing protein [Methanosarcina sp.]|nr:DUF1673 domain-containing protein [Methanosarcina sp.]